MLPVLWIIRVDSDNFLTFTKKEQSREMLPLFKTGQKLLDFWEQINLEPYLEEEVEKPIPDFIRGIVSIAISRRARKVLEPIIENQVEFLLLLSPFGYYYELNIKRVDCLNEVSSKVIRFPSSGRIMDIEKYSINWEKLIGINIFLLPELGLSPWFVSSTFKQIVKDNKLTGLLFDPVPLEE